MATIRVLLIEANRLLDNPDRAAGLEMLLRGPRLRLNRLLCCGISVPVCATMKALFCHRTLAGRLQAK